MLEALAELIGPSQWSDHLNTWNQVLLTARKHGNREIAEFAVKCGAQRLECDIAGL